MGHKQNVGRDRHERAIIEFRLGQAEIRRIVNAYWTRNRRDENGNGCKEKKRDREERIGTGSMARRLNEAELLSEIERPAVTYK